MASRCSRGELDQRFSTWGCTTDSPVGFVTILQIARGRITNPKWPKQNDKQTNKIPPCHLTVHNSILLWGNLIHPESVL